MKSQHDQGFCLTTIGKKNSYFQPPIARARVEYKKEKGNEVHKIQKRYKYDRYAHGTDVCEATSKLQELPHS